MKGAIMLDGKRLELGDRVRILAGPYAGCTGFFKGRSTRRKGKLHVATMRGYQSSHILVEEDAIAREVPKLTERKREKSST
jgi:hypothetical protein